MGGLNQRRGHREEISASRIGRGKGEPHVLLTRRITSQGTQVWKQRLMEVERKKKLGGGEPGGRSTGAKGSGGGEFVTKNPRMLKPREGGETGEGRIHCQKVGEERRSGEGGLGIYEVCHGGKFSKHRGGRGRGQLAGIATKGSAKNRCMRDLSTRTKKERGRINSSRGDLMGLSGEAAKNQRRRLDGNEERSAREKKTKEEERGEVKIRASLCSQLESEGPLREE